VTRRTHARRDPLVVDHKKAGVLNPLNDSELRRLTKIFAHVRRADGDIQRAMREIEDLRESVEELLDEDSTRMD
jgi:hypothetical protein